MQEKYMGPKILSLGSGERYKIRRQFPSWGWSKLWEYCPMWRSKRLREFNHFPIIKLNNTSIKRNKNIHYLEEGRRIILQSNLK